jgi:glutamate decarboxylase
MGLHRHVHHTADTGILINPLVDGQLEELPRFRLPDGELAQETAYQLVHDELMLDGNPRLNLATFLTTWMEPRAQTLIAECLNKNMVNRDEYPQAAEIEKRCVNILADLWHAPEGGTATGCSTTGSSEAAMLGGLALKWRWRSRRLTAGQPVDRPNLVMGANAQVCWEKFCRYWDVEPRHVPLSEEHLHLTADGAVSHCDENTIGVVAAMGSTLDGSYEPVAEISGALDRMEAEQGFSVPMHVDAASGGFIAPFIDPDVKWDFQLDRVQSINASGHKFGLVYPGVGWAIWRDAAALPEDLVFSVNYLGGEMDTFSLNFSRPAAQVAAQYYIFLRLGRDGFRKVQGTTREIARTLAGRVAELGPFRLLSDGSQLPAFAFALRDDIDSYTVFNVATRLRERGWLLPAYTLPPDLEDVAVLRVVVRSGFSRDLADLLIEDLRQATTDFEAHPPNPDRELRSGFHH